MSTAEATDLIFGLVLMNDWSARDLQRWEGAPLGPFTSKNFVSCPLPALADMQDVGPLCVLNGHTNHILGNLMTDQGIRGKTKAVKPLRSVC